MQKFPRTWIRWSEEEVQFLKEHFPSKTDKWLGAKLSRTLRSVKSKARRLGLKKERYKPPANFSKRKYTPWTPELVEKIKELYPNCSNEEIAEKSDVSYGTVTSMASRLGLKKSHEYRSKLVRKYRGKWTEEMDEKLKELYPTTDTKDLAERFNVTEGAIRSRAYKLGVKKKLETKELEPNKGTYLMEKGRKGEIIAEELFREKGWEIVRRGNTRTHYDFIIQKSDLRRIVQVKYGKRFTVKERPLIRLMEKKDPTYILYIGEETKNPCWLKLEEEEPI